MRAYKWGDLATLEYGKNLRDYTSEPTDEDIFPVYGTNGRIGWCKEPLRKQPGIIIGRKGAYRGVHYSYEPFFVIDTAYHLNLVSSEVDSRWAYYQLLTVDINRLDSGSAIPSTKREDFYSISVKLPSKPIQEKIATILSAYDDLIENNLKRIALLEESARLLYKEWFVRLRFPGHEHTRIVDGVPDRWERLPLENALVLQRGFDLPIQQRQEGDVPIYGSTGITGYHSKAIVNAPGVVTGRSGTLGIVHYVSEDFFPLNTALWVREFKRVKATYAFFLLQNLGLEQFNAGVSVPTLDRKIVHRLPILIPNVQLLELFDNYVSPIFRMTHKLKLQNQKLKQTRDLLLPRLMNGEIPV